MLDAQAKIMATARKNLHKVIPTGIRGIFRNRGKYRGSSMQPPQTPYLNSL